jgi:hypothetical protein
VLSFAIFADRAGDKCLVRCSTHASTTAKTRNALMMAATMTASTAGMDLSFFVILPP